MSRRATPLLVEDIWEAIEKIQRYVAGLDHDAFIKDDKTIDSVVRNLKIIGEVANRVPEDFRARHTEIEWHRIIGLRNRIVHDYFSIDVEIVWEIVQKDLPVFNQNFHKFTMPSCDRRRYGCLSRRLKSRT